jgi:hypothetical protein
MQAGDGAEETKSQAYGYKISFLIVNTHLFFPRMKKKCEDLSMPDMM